MSRKDPQHNGRRFAALALAITLSVGLTVGMGAVAPSSATGGPATAPGSEPTGTATKTPTVKPTVKPGKVIRLRRGDTGRKVRDLKARLVQRKLLRLPFDGRYDRATANAVRTLQERRHLPVTGKLDKRTWKRLRNSTHTPSRADRAGRAPVIGIAQNRPGPLDRRCRSGRVLCIDKSSRTMRWVVDGQVRMLFDTRFGSSATPTREGVFRVYRKSRDHVSSLFHTAMPFAMFFDGGQAVHFSSDFTARGYAGASHGCINIRDYNNLRALFDQVPIGTRVVVYWS